MATKSRRTERLLNLFTLLFSSWEGKTAKEIQQLIPQYQETKSLSAFERMLRRDLQALRSAGVPIEISSTSEYRISPRSYNLPVVQFTEAELKCLGMASKVVEYLSPSLGEVVDSGLRKMVFGNWESLRRAQRSGLDLELQLVRDEGGLSPEMLETLLGAVLNYRRIRIRYRALSTGEITTRDVDPYALTIYEGQWYLVGFCYLREEIRTFKGIRMQKVSLSPKSSKGRGPDFTVPKDFNLEEYVGIPAWKYERGEEAVKAEVWFASDIWWWVRREWGKYGICEERPDGGIITIEVNDPEAFVAAVLEFGRHALVLKPPALREKVIETLHKIVEESSPL